MWRIHPRKDHAGAGIHRAVVKDPTGADIHIAVRGGPRQRRYSYASPWRTPLEQISTQQPMEEHAEADKQHGSMWRTPCRSRWICPEGRCSFPSIWKAHAGVGSWQVLPPVRKCSGGNRFSVKNCSLCGTCAGIVFS